MTSIASDGQAPSRHPAGIVLRPLVTHAELEACVALQTEVWGEGFADVTSPALLKVVQEVGGVAAGAFSADEDRLEGFVFGVSGVRGGRPAHWSHMLAVRPGHRGRGLGVLLKRYQRELLLEAGIETVFWTFDPLVARNAHLNLVRLGAGIERYVRDYYGTGGDSALSAGIGTDRMIVRWELASERATRALARDGRAGATDRPADPARAPVVDVVERADGSVDPWWPEGDDGDGPVAAWRELPAVRVEIPADILAVRDRDPERARGWRRASRHALEAALGRGYRVETLIRAAPIGGETPRRCWYLLLRGEP